MSESHAPLVSAVIPAHNAERYIGPAIESILAQPHRPIEIIVVDDGSDDATAAVARSFGPPVRVIAEPHAGAGAARNRGVEEARGEFLAFLDADDLWTPGKLACQLGCLQADPSLDYVLGHAVEFRTAPDGTVSEGVTMLGAAAGAMLIRRQAFQLVGLLRTDLRTGEFIDWFARAREMGLPSAVAPEIVLRRRIHAANMGITDRAGRADYAEVVRAALARRRGTS